MKHVLMEVEPPYTPEVARILARYPQDRDGYILKLFRVFANSTRFLKSKGPSDLLDKESPLTLREREIVILRTTANVDCEYEWGVHVTAFGRAAKLTEAQVHATRNSDHRADCWTASERVLVECVDQLCANAKIRDATYAKFQECWNLEQQLEILALCGNYHLISFVANTARIELESSAARFASNG